MRKEAYNPWVCTNKSLIMVTDSFESGHKCYANGTGERGKRLGELDHDGDDACRSLAPIQPVAI